MSFTPLLPFSGYSGWAFLQRTKAMQQATFDRAPQSQRLAAHARENLAKVTTAKELVDDRRLLQVALGAFGLGEEINNRFFIQKILESPPGDKTALAGKLTDKRFAKLAEAFGFGIEGGPPPRPADFADKIVAAWQTRSFEVAVGEQDDTMRLAMNAERELADMGNSTASNNALWFSIMGNAPLRKVFEGALGLPASFGKLDIDRQLSDLKWRSQQMFGSDQANQFADPIKREELVRKFILRSEAQAMMNSYSPASGALTLLQSASRMANRG